MKASITPLPHPSLASLKKMSLLAVIITASMLPLGLHLCGMHVLEWRRVVMEDGEGVLGLNEEGVVNPRVAHIVREPRYKRCKVLKL